PQNRHIPTSPSKAAFTSRTRLCSIGTATSSIINCGKTPNQVAGGRQSVNATICTRNRLPGIVRSLVLAMVESYVCTPGSTPDSLRYLLGFFQLDEAITPLCSFLAESDCARNSADIPLQ